MKLDNYNLVFIQSAMKALGFNTDISDGHDYRQRLYGSLTCQQQTAVANYIDRAL